LTVCTNPGRETTERLTDDAFRMPMQALRRMSWRMGDRYRGQSGAFKGTYFLHKTCLEYPNETCPHVILAKP